MSKRDRLAEVVVAARKFRFCGPSDDPDEQTAVTTGYRYLLVQLKRLAAPLLPEAEATRLNAIEVDVNDIYSAYDAHAEVDALLPDIEAALERSDDGELSVGGNALTALRKLLHVKGRDDLVKLLARTNLRFDVSDQYGSYLFSLLTAAEFRAPIEDCEKLRALPDEDVALVLDLLQEVHPPHERDMEIARVNFLVDPERPTIVGLNDFTEPTGWARVDRAVAEMRDRLRQADAEEQYQAVGLLCREILISLAQVVYDPAEHSTLDGIEASDSDAKRMLEAYLELELAGSGNREARKHARASLDLANKLQHDRTATFRVAALCAEATTSVVSIVAVVSGQRDSGD